MISVTIQSPNFELGADWDDLVSRAHPNVFMSPAALRAADATQFSRIHVLLAWDDRAQPRRLVGLWAMQQSRALPFWTTVLDALPFEYAFLSSPVVDPDVAAVVMPAFFRAIADAPDMPRVIRMKSLDTEAASYRPLIDAIEARGGRVLTIKTESRPVIWRDTTEKASGERRKKLRQGWKRMSALGVAAIVFVSDPQAIAAEVETFLQLEFKSWKGAAGTALLCRDGDANFVRRLIANLAEQGQAAIQTLQIDGQTIATQVVLFSGTMGYTWKTAFDKAYAKFSPGVVLIDRVTEHLFATTHISGIDSCSAENSFMSQLWYGRRAMADVLVAVGPGRSAGFWWEAARQVGRERLKQWRDRLVAWRAARQSRPVPPAAGSAVAAPAMTTTGPTPDPGAATIAAEMDVETVSPPLVQDQHPVVSQARPAPASTVRFVI